MKDSSVKVKLLGYFADKLGPEVQISGVGNLFDLKSKMEVEYPVLKDKRYSFAVNQKLETLLSKTISEKDEIALLPPFAGG